MDVESIERFERANIALVERRAREKSSANELAEAWKASERAFRERSRRRIRAAWYAYHADLADSLRERADEHDARAVALLEEKS